MNLKKIAQYPFLQEAFKYTKEKGFELEDLIKDRAYADVRVLGKSRVLEAIEEGMIKEHSLVSDEKCIQELLSYPIARMIVSCAADNFIIKRYALAEAITASNRLKNENTVFIIEAASQLGIDAEEYEAKVKIHFTDFLKNTSQMRSLEWKLVNQDIERGYVILPVDRFIRVLQEALRKKIERELPVEVNEEILKIFKGDVAEVRFAADKLKKVVKAEDLGKITVTRLPPCMTHLLAMSQQGENIPHSGRFALTSFLHTIGLSAEEIIKIFATCPDFDEKKSRYQIEHISGIISGTEYTPPECSTMKSYGLCFNPDELCSKEWMTHPLKYYRLKSKPKRSEVERQASKQK